MSTPSVNLSQTRNPCQLSLFSSHGFQCTLLYLTIQRSGESHTKRV